MATDSQFWSMLSSVALGGVVAALATLYFNSLNSERSVRRAKLEELCDLLNELRHATSSAAATARRNNVIALGNLPTENLDRAYTLVAIYFPGALSSINVALQAIGATRAGSGNRSLDEVIADLDKAYKGLTDAYATVLVQAWQFHRWPFRRD